MDPRSTPAQLEEYRDKITESHIELVWEHDILLHHVGYQKTTLRRQTCVHEQWCRNMLENISESNVVEYQYMIRHRQEHKERQLANLDNLEKKVDEYAEAIANAEGTIAKIVKALAEHVDIPMLSLLDCANKCHQLVAAWRPLLEAFYKELHIQERRHEEMKIEEKNLVVYLRALMVTSAHNPNRPPRGNILRERN